MLYITANGPTNARRMAAEQSGGRPVKFVRTLCVPGSGRTYQFEIVDKPNNPVL